MKFSQTYWLNYKNLKPERVCWYEGLNLIVGPNASGKTNTLEALSMLCGWWGSRRKKLKDLVNWQLQGRGVARLHSKFCGEEELAVSMTIDEKRVIEISGKQGNASILRAFIPCLSFWSDDVYLVDGPPYVRRNFLNQLCALIVPLYARRLYDYNKLLRHRNHSLKRGQYDSVIIKTMAPLAAWIWSYRRTIVDLLKISFKEISPSLLDFDVEIDMKEGSCDLFEDPLEGFYKSVAAFKNDEMARRVSLAGPHRDDLSMTITDRPASEALSRGQRRKLAVALMLSAAKVVEFKMRKRPIILLDEITAELDSEAKSSLINALFNSGCQVIAATADDRIGEFPGKVWHIDQGGLSV